MIYPDPQNVDRLIRYWNPDPSELSVIVDGVNHYYGTDEARKQVLFNNQLKIRAGEIVIMTGPSGSGKTTLLTLIGTLRSVMEGSLKVLGTELYGLPPEEIVELRKQIGFIFQAHNLFESLTAFQNVKMATELIGESTNDSTPKIEAVLTRLGLGERIHYKPKSLSGGQKQRVAVARGLIHEPKIILADEPTAALDAESGREVVTMFQELASELGVTIIIVTHDNRILDVADRMVKMVDGNIVSNVLVKRNELICQILIDHEKSDPNRKKLFSNLTPSVLTSVADQMELRQFKSGQDIIVQGDLGKEFFVIGKGDVDIIIDGQSVTELRAGSYFGEVALLEDTTRNATVRAKNDVACFILDKAEFKSIIDASPTFEEELRKAIFERR